MVSINPLSWFKSAKPPAHTQSKLPINQPPKPAGTTSRVVSNLSKPVNETDILTRLGKPGEKAASKLTEAASKQEFIGKAITKLGKLPVGAALGGAIAGAFETIDEFFEVKQGFKEGRGILQSAHSALEVAGTTAGAVAGTAGGMLAGGAVSGAITGSALGSAVPVVGNVIGAVAGFAVGAGIACLGTSIGNEVGNNAGTTFFGENREARLKRLHKDMQTLGLNFAPQQAAQPQSVQPQPQASAVQPQNPALTQEKLYGSAGQQDQHLAMLAMNDPQFYSMLYGPQGLMSK